MLLNPFTPSDIASNPEDFFGRANELRDIQRFLNQGSVAIRGAIGIGKSSLLAQIFLIMEGFGSPKKCFSARAVGHKNIQNVDDAAQLLLESYVDIDEKSRKITFSLPKIITFESEEICRYFQAGRHLSCLERILQKIHKDMLLDDIKYLILGIDEADRCPIPLAQMIRVLSTHIQQEGVKNIRFILAGTSPYFQHMINEDPGLNRFFYKKLTLDPMLENEALDLIQSKLESVIIDAEKKGIELKIEESVVNRIIDLSGGHPHILQLLGSYLIEHENADPDGIIDNKDLVTSLRAICYEDRAPVYNSTIHQLELYGQIENLIRLYDNAYLKFPTRIERHLAKELIGEDALEWLVNHNIITPVSSDEYGLVDEFLRIRMKMDQFDTDEEINITEKKLIDEEDFEDNEGGTEI